jgi:outer membrane usher protein
MTGDFIVKTLTHKHARTTVVSATSRPPARHLSPVCVRVLLALLAGSAFPALADDYFDPALLSLGEGQAVDLSQFEKKGGQAEGRYHVDIYVNGQFSGTRDLDFVHDSTGALRPVVTPLELDDWGVNLKSRSDLAGLPPREVMSRGLAGYIPQATTSLDFSRMTLQVMVPQLYMKPRQDDLADPALWQSGDPAFLLNYNLSGSTYESKMNGNKNNNQGFFASLQPGLNIGPWRLRNSSTYSYNQQRYDEYDYLEDEKNRMVRTQSRWASQQTYLQRDIAMLRSQLTLGETSTGSVASQVLDGFSYRGAGLMSSDAMIPGSMTGFAPVIAGIARTNARVTVTQNGMVVYEANVAPGPFRFDDIFANGSSGDLKVTIHETDGTTHGFSQPYSTLPVMLREGQLRYEVAAGQYYVGHGGYNATGTPGFGMVTAIYGLPHGVTIYGGGLGASNYQSAALGAGFSILDYGALSLDVTRSRTLLDGTDDPLTGQSYRARYSKSMLTSGTTVDLTAYRYSTRNFMSFNDANNRGYDTSTGLPSWLNGRRRSTFEVRLSQTLFEDYSVTLSGHRDDYWGTDKVNNTLNAGVSGSIKQVGWSLNYNIDRIRGERNDWPENRQLSLNLNVPMSLFGSAAALQNAYANYTLSHDNTGRTSSQLSMGGSMLEDNRMSWSVSQSEGNQGQGNSGSASLGYNSDMGMGNLGYNYDNSGGRGVTYSASGGLLAHRHGVTLARNISDTAVLVHTGVPDVKIMNGDVTTDRWGNAVVTSMRTYARNTIDIDPSSLPEGANPSGGSHFLYPTAGAVMVEDYPVRLGQQVLMNLTHNGVPVPFGAMAALKNDPDAGQGSIVGEGGQVYLSGMPQKGTLLVQWGGSASAQCEVPFTLPAPVQRKKDDKSWHPVKTLDMTCR